MNEVTKTIETTVGDITFRALKRKDMKRIIAAQKEKNEDEVFDVMESCVISGKENLDDLIVGEYTNLISEIQKFSSEYVSKN